jgi:HD-GYP domain-containing protein (c-di-GMP phosphodiesterase class II)
MMPRRGGGSTLLPVFFFWGEARLRMLRRRERASIIESLNRRILPLRIPFALHDRPLDDRAFPLSQSLTAIAGESGLTHPKGWLFVKKPAFLQAAFFLKFFCLALLVLAWSVLVFSLRRDRQNEIAAAFRQTDNLARAFEEHTLRTVENVRQVLSSMKELYEKRAGHIYGSFADAANAAIARYAVESNVAQAELLNLLSIADASGDLVLSSQIPFRKVNVVFRPFFTDHRGDPSKTFLIGDPILGSATGKWYIPMSMRLENADGSFSGVVLASVNPYYFSDFYRQVRLGEKGSVLLVGPSGSVLAGFIGDESLPFGTSVASSDVARTMNGATYGVCICDGPTDTVRRIVSFRSVDPYRNLVVIVGMSEDEILAGYRNRRNYEILAILAFSVFVGVFFLLSSRAMQREQETRDALRLKVEEERRAQEMLVHAHRELSQAYEDTIKGWAGALELRDLETGGHSSRVTELTVRIARRMGVPEDTLPYIHYGALLHDVGKMGIPDGILLKPGPLTEDEWGVMKRHPSYAADLLSQIGFLSPALEIPTSHHEKWDGTGYPKGLRGEGIPIAARIFAVVDVWDALLSNRPYRKAWAEEEARAYIRESSGTHFDPRVVDVFFSVLDER